MTKDRSFSTAIHILVSLAYQTPNQVSSEELAAGLKTNPALVRRVLSQLSKGGLVNSSRGKGGGSTLAKSAEKITLQDVYIAMEEGPLFGSFDKAPLKQCPVSCNIGGTLETLYAELEDGLLKNLKGISIRDVLGRLGCGK